jgi:hypothetical protein
VAIASACSPESVPPEGDTIACAIGEGTEFAEVCTLERVAGDGSTFLIYGPDGSFRRLMIDPATGAFGAEDGADMLEVVSQDGKMAEFSIAGDRYRIPHKLVRQLKPGQ